MEGYCLISLFVRPVAGGITVDAEYRCANAPQHNVSIRRVCATKQAWAALWDELSTASSALEAHPELALFPVVDQNTTVANPDV